MSEFHVDPSKGVVGRLTVPGDKSISHRALMLGAIADGTTHIEGFLESEDCLATLAARFTPPPMLDEPKTFIRQDTAPVAEPAPVAAGYEPSIEAPPSVTEHTTHFFEESQQPRKRESQ